MTELLSPPASIPETYDRVRRLYGSAIGRPRSEIVTPALDPRPAGGQAEHQPDGPPDRRAAGRDPAAHQGPQEPRARPAPGRGRRDRAVVRHGLGGDRPRPLGARPHLRRQHRRRAAQAPGAGRAGPRGRRHGRRRRRRRTSTPCRRPPQAAGSELGVLVEIDTGMDRCGADTPDEAVDLARRVVDRPGLRLLGITGYEGHCSLTPDHDQRLAKETHRDGLLHRDRRPVRARGPALPDPVGRRDRDLGLDRRVPRDHRDPGRHVRGHGQLPRPDGRRVRAFADGPGDRHQPPPGPGHRRRRGQVDGRRRPRLDRRPPAAVLPLRRGARRVRRVRRLDARRGRRGPARSRATRRRPSTGTTRSMSSRTTWSSTSGRSSRAAPATRA